jgi:hypothetical protein
MKRGGVIRRGGPVNPPITMRLGAGVVEMQCMERLEFLLLHRRQRDIVIVLELMRDRLLKERERLLDTQERISVAPKNLGSVHGPLE